VVRAAAKRANILNFKDYVLIGDDIVIANDLVASHYSDIMRELGVPINALKSLHGSHVEICKRLFTPTGEITPLPLRLFAQSFKDYRL